MSKKFVHLHVHSEYSIEDGLIRIVPLIDQAVAIGSPSIALTEQGNLFSALKFYRAAQKKGIKPIIGAEIRIKNHDNNEASSRLILLCQNYHGYKNLNLLISRSYLQGQHYKRKVPFVSKDWLTDYADGLIALSGAQHGDVGQALVSGNYTRAKALLREWQTIFPDRFYLELQRINLESEEHYIYMALKLSIETDVPVVATNNVRFLEQKDFAAHEARVCIQKMCTLVDYQKFPSRYTEKQYFRSPTEMVELFSDIPSAIENTVAIAQRCNIKLTIGENYLPDFPVPESFDQNTWLIKKTKEGLDQLLILTDDDNIHETRDIYHDRLEMELEVIIKMGFSGYFLIVSDFIQWAKENKIPVGPGRGSGAGSLVAYALRITALDPIQYDLLFERFLNPERVSLPDFDIDFCVVRRDEVIDYVVQKYGSDRVSHIITYGRMSARSVIRDVGRVLGYAYGFFDQLSKLIPMDPKITLERALQDEVLLKERYENEDDVNSLIDLARQLEGITRHASRHAGGIVISPQPLTDYMPLYYEQGSEKPISQFDMHDVEAIGLVKFDFLGLRTLTIIHETMGYINEIRQPQGKPMLDINTIPLDDQQTYKLICRNETNAIFQLESDGMKKVIKRIQPNVFDDLISLVALFRPGPLQSGMVDDYIERKHGRKEIKYLHHSLEHILQPTNGVILYQEQVMQIAQTLAGYTLGSADLLRSAMGKKKFEEMAEQRDVFIKGAVGNGIDASIAQKIFNLMEKFAGYGFNKSHSATYALVSYQTAWLKSHYPAYFMASVFSSEMGNFDKIVMLVDEVKSMGITLNQPSVNHSQYKFIAEDKGSIRFGLGSIKGISAAVCVSIINARDKGGAFIDIADLCRRVNMSIVNRRMLDFIVRSGAADGLGPSRGYISATLNNAVRLAEQSNSNHNSGQTDFFGLVDTDNENEDVGEQTCLQVDEWSDDERLAGEKETLGFYLKGHPIIRYEDELSGIISTKLRDIKVMSNICVAGYIHRFRTRLSRSGKLAEIVLDDGTARADLRVYAEVFKNSRNSIIKDRLIIVRGDIVEDDFSTHGVTIVAKKIYLLEQLREYATMRLKCSDVSLQARTHDLKELLLSHASGASRIIVEYSNADGKVTLAFADQWKVTVDDELLDSLRNSFGKDNVWLDYFGIENSLIFNK